MSDADNAALLALAERCEAASFEEQADILISARNALRGPPPKVRVERQPDGTPWPGNGLGPHTVEWKAWQASATQFANMLKAGAFLDAAMTLVPADVWWLVEGRQKNGYSACVDNPDEYFAKTPALALCAAALRALAFQKSGPTATQGADTMATEQMRH